MRRKTGFVRSNEFGLTLVELMISMLLLAILAGGALMSMQGQQESATISTTRDDALNNARAIMAALSYQLRALPARLPSGRVRINATNDAPWGTNTSCATLEAPVIQVINSTTSSDALRVLMPDGSAWGALSVSGATQPAALASTDSNLGMRTVSGAAPSAIERKDWMLITNFQNAIVLRAQSDPYSCAEGICVLKLPSSTAYASPNPQSGDMVLRAQWLQYVVSNSYLNQNAFVAIDLVDNSVQPAALNIEDFQVALGIDIDNNGVLAPENAGAGDADEWVYNHPSDTWPWAAGTCDLTGLRAIRLTLVALAPRRGRDTVGNRPAVEDRSAGSEDGRYRVVLQTVVAPRN